MAAKQFYIIGVSGVTNSGKSTIGSRLSKDLPNCTWICQDHYYLATDDPRVEIEPNGMQNWDKLSALDMDTLLSDVFAWIDKHKTLTPPSQAFLIIDGFTIFNHRPLSNLCDKKFFLQVDRDTCYDRRGAVRADFNPTPSITVVSLSRITVSNLSLNATERTFYPDKRLGFMVKVKSAPTALSTRVYDPPDLPGYFSEIVWPMYLKNLKDLDDQKDIEYVDALFDLDTLYQQIYDNIQSSFINNKS